MFHMDDKGARRLVVITWAFGSDTASVAHYMMLWEHPPTPQPAGWEYLQCQLLFIISEESYFHELKAQG